MDKAVYSSGLSFHNASTSQVFVVVTSTSTVLSMIGALLIFYTYYAWKEIRTSSRRILVYISIADFFTALGNMFSVVQNSESSLICEIQSFITTTSSLWSFFWSTFMAVYLFLTVARRTPIIAEKLLCVFHFCAWGLPLGITGAAWARHVLGDSRDQFTAGWCWIKKMERDKQIMWMWFTGKGWEIATYILIFGFYTALKWHIHKDLYYRHQQFTTIDARHAAIKADRKLTCVPIVFILCRIWGTLRFLLYVCHVPTENLVWLFYLQGVGDSAQGFANFMLFCFFTEKFQKRLRLICCPCFHKSLSRNDSSHIITAQNASDVPKSPTINEHTPLNPSLR